MGLIKPSGKSATDSRHGTLHGSTPHRRMAKWGGALERNNEKPWRGGERPGNAKGGWFGKK